MLSLHLHLVPTGSRKPFNGTHQGESHDFAYGGSKNFTNSYYLTYYNFTNTKLPGNFMLTTQ